MKDLSKSDNLSNIKSIEQIEYDPNKTWNCPICTFENVAKNEKCIMCETEKKPTFNSKKKEESTTINKEDVEIVKHPNAVDDGDW